MSVNNNNNNNISGLNDRQINIDRNSTGERRSSVGEGEGDQWKETAAVLLIPCRTEMELTASWSKDGAIASLDSFKNRLDEMILKRT